MNNLSQDFKKLNHKGLDWVKKGESKGLLLGPVTLSKQKSSNCVKYIHKIAVR